MLQKILLFSLFLGVVFAANSANQYVDNVLQTTLQQQLRSENLLPARVEDFFFDLNEKSTNRTDVAFTFGNITGLDRISRKGECSGPRNYRGEITINCTLSLHPLQATHRTMFRNSSYAHIGQVHVSFTELDVDLQIVGNQNNHGFVRYFNVPKFDTLTPVFNNFPADLRGDLAYIQKVYKRHALGDLHFVFEHPYTDAVRTAFLSKPMPRQ